MIDYALYQRPPLYEAVYGGPPPSRQELRTCIRENGIVFPCHVVTIQHRWQQKLPLTDKRALRGIRHLAPLHIHPGLVYVCFQGEPATLLKHFNRRGIQCGEPFESTTPASLVRAIRDAIVSLRVIVLKPAVRRYGAELPLAAEIEARNEALQLIRGGEPHEAALRKWLDILLIRNLRNLNTIRRRMTEFLSQLTREIDTHTQFAHPFAAAVARIFETFAYAELPGVFEEIIAMFVPRLASMRNSLTPSGKKFSASVQGAIDFMKVRAHHPISLADVAAAVHTSAPYLSRIFRRETGRTLTEYLQALRIDAAKKMLAENDSGTLQVANACGFNSPEHFFRTFRKLAGMTPRAWRRAHSI